MRVGWLRVARVFLLFLICICCFSVYRFFLNCLVVFFWLFRCSDRFVLFFCWFWRLINLSFTLLFSLFFSIFLFYSKYFVNAILKSSFFFFPTERNSTLKHVFFVFSCSPVFFFFFVSLFLFSCVFFLGFGMRCNVLCSVEVEQIPCRDQMFRIPTTRKVILDGVELNSSLHSCGWQLFLMYFLNLIKNK